MLNVANVSFLCILACVACGVVAEEAVPPLGNDDASGSPCINSLAKKRSMGD